MLVSTKNHREIGYYLGASCEHQQLSPKVERNIFHFATLLSSCEKSSAWFFAAQMLHQAGIATLGRQLRLLERMDKKQGDVT